ncbi:MAG: DEAD/DEAH box helicase [Polyangiaceae bacterium]|nr:DEAD/DEAH box helicase [Polyangiaceae bacterium]
MTNGLVIGDALRLRVSEEWLNQPSQDDVSRWIGNELDARPTAQNGLVTIDLPLARWAEWGILPDADAEPEVVDAWCSNLQTLARLLGTSAQRIGISSVGHVGAKDFDLLVSLNGSRVAAGAAPVAQTAEGPEMLLPPALAVLGLAQPLWGGTRLGREEQLAALAALRAYTARLEAVLGQSDMVSVELDEHLASFRFERVDRAALVWKVAGKKGDIYDLSLERTNESGESVPLPVGDLHPSAPVISVSGKEHLILSDDIDAVARIQKKYRNKVRKQVASALSDPSAVLPSGRTFDGLDLGRYSPRVAGFVPVVRVERAADIRSSGVDWYKDDEGGAFLHLEIAQPDGSGVTIEFATPEESQAFLDEARQNSAGTPMRVKEVDIIPTKPLTDRIEERLALHANYRPDAADQPVSEPDADEMPDPGGEGAKAKPGRLAAVIREVDEARPLAPADSPIDDAIVPWHRLDALLTSGSAMLKPHQRQGIAWLWHHYTRERHGVCLADDMGLGKTLQISAFLALQRTEGREVDRKRPTLIVAPVILLENWTRELAKFFKPEVFESLLVLRDQALRSRVEHGRLDVSTLPHYDYIVTNYDTLARYQQQLLSIDYATVVLDEAQAVKNPDALRTLAARGLKRSFAICSTGTPVENRLLDLWTLYEVISPGEPFGRRADFEETYEADVGDGVKALRKALLLPSAASSLLRRTKKEAQPSLPPKHDTVRLVAMTPDQLATERIVTRGSGSRSILETLQSLQKLYQHPRLLMRAEEAERGSRTTDEIVAESPKLQMCLDILAEVRKAGEKALVFTLWTKMQDLLARVLRERFDLPIVRIINGQTNQQRKAQEYLDEFEKDPGFAVLVLSPLAAGSGLTITAANHVIHYGRWWNPAKEDQATDRAYRIGQTKPVHVHFPVLHHPGDVTAGFDVGLHELVSRKRSMARDFLDPRRADDVTPEELQRLAQEKL